MLRAATGSFWRKAAVPKGMSGSGVVERQAGRSFDVRFVRIATKNWNTMREWLECRRDAADRLVD